MQDDFTDPAYEKALDEVGGGKADYLDTVTIWLMGAEWARTHLAAQEPTDAEVEAAALAVSAADDDACIFCTPGDTPCEVCTKYARVALSAARNAGRGEG